MRGERHLRPNAAAGAACLVGLLALFHCVRDIDSDEGVILHGAWSILNGRTPYTDFFEFVAPASFYVVASVWRLLGDSYWTAKFIGIAAIGATAAAVYRTGIALSEEARRPSRPRSLFFSSAVLVLFSATWPAINHNTFHAPLAAWCGYFLVRTLQKWSLTDAAIAGAFNGLSILMLQHKGLVFAATAWLMLLAQAMKHRDMPGPGRCFLTFSSTAVLPVLATLLIWPASLLYEDLVAFPASHYLKVNRTSMGVYAYVASLVFLVCWRLRFVALPSVRLLVYLQLVLILTALQRPDMCHITQTLIPLLCLSPLWIEPALDRPRSLSVVLCVCGMFALSIPSAGMRAAYVLYADFVGNSPDPAIEYASRHCSSIYAGPFEPGLYYELRKLNPTRFPFLVSGMNTTAQFEDAAADLKARRPSCAVLNRTKVLKYNYNWSNAVDDYIRKNYALVEGSGSYEVWTERASGDRTSGSSP